MPVNRSILRAYSGREWSLTNPKPEQFHIIDIARGLSQENRFTGQTNPSLSVATHSLIVWQHVKEAGGSIQEQLWALLHDAAEAYLGDLPSPVKKVCKSYQKIEARVLKAILKRYGLRGKMPKIVKKADDAALTTERRFYFGQGLKEHPSVWARHTYLNTFFHLYSQHFFGVRK